MARRVGIIEQLARWHDPHPNPPLFKGRERAADAAPPHAIALPFRGREARAADSFLPLKGGGIRRESCESAVGTFIDDRKP
jgi:hypothetical protein